MYREDILEHFKHPVNRGRLANADATARKANPQCGDVLSITVKYDTNRKNIADARFEGSGCAISMASASLLMEEIQKHNVFGWVKLSDQEYLAMLDFEDIAESRKKCALLSLHTLQEALNKTS